MLNRVGVASSFAITASLLSAIAAVASTTGPTAIAARAARSATALPAATGGARGPSNGAAPLVAGDSAVANPMSSASSPETKAVAALWAAAAGSGGHPATNGAAQAGPEYSGAAASTPHQPSSAPRPVSTPPTTAPSASPPPYNCAGSDDGMTEAYKHAREQYCQGGGE